MQTAYMYVTLHTDKNELTFKNYKKLIYIKQDCLSNRSYIDCMSVLINLKIKLFYKSPIIEVKHDRNKIEQLLTGKPTITFNKEEQHCKIA